MTSARVLLPVALLLVPGACQSGEEARPAAGAGSRAAESTEATPTVSEATARLPDTPAGRLVARSIDLHDPEGAWWNRPVSLRWVSSRPGGEERVATIRFDNAASRFELEMELRGHALEMRVDGDAVVTRVDGAPARQAPAEVRERLRLHRENGLYWQNYFHFLVGLPMKLTDPGAGLAEAPDTVDFQGAEVLAVRVQYDPDDRYPWWEFYFAPDDARLVGARFWNEGRDVDGEYITMEGAAEAGSLRLPAERRWYTNADDEHLGTDRVEGLEIVGG